MSTQNRRPNIFIASSTEGIEVARAVKQNFDEEADVEIWNEDIFKVNSNYLDTLLNRASFYDYVIAVFTPDDEAIIREKQVKVTRDNVIFEFGLFLGRIGPKRSFFLLQEGVELFSDWSGIETAKFRVTDNLVAAVGNACNKIRREMQVAERLQLFSLLPSTSLAIGYYYNFLRRVFDAFRQVDKVKIAERDVKGNIIAEAEQDIIERSPTIEVRVPKNLAELDPDTIKQRTSALKQITITANVRSFPFYIDGDFVNGREFKLFDIPTTMYASFLAIQKIFTDEFLARDNNQKLIESREIANFEKTLRILVPNKIEEKYFNFIVIE